MQQHECNKHNYLCINDSLNFLLPCENQGVTKSNTKKVHDILSFLMCINLPSSDQRFRFYDILHDDGFAENCDSEQIAVLKEK
jgi:hypothetical protein